MRGTVLQLAYRLRRHLWLSWPLSHWLGLLLFAGALAALFRWWPAYWSAVCLGVSFLSYVALHSWAAHTRYVRFETMAEGCDPFEDVPSLPPLLKEEKVPVRVSGGFAVEGRERYYMDVRANFETVGTREHIILGRIYSSRFLGLGRWPPDEVGWWYIFFQPAMIRSMCLGHLYFGPRPRQALRVIYARNDETQETVYFASEDLTALRRVLDDLLRDCPAGVETLMRSST